MNWKKLKENVIVPIMTEEGINEMISSCLKKDGQNTRHSRSIKMSNYKAPIEDKESVNTNEIEEMKFELIRYMARFLSKKYRFRFAVNEILPKNIWRYSCYIARFTNHLKYDRFRNKKEHTKK